MPHIEMGAHNLRCKAKWLQKVYNSFFGRHHGLGRNFTLRSNTQEAWKKFKRAVMAANVHYSQQFQSLLQGQVPTPIQVAANDLWRKSTRTRT